MNQTSQKQNEFTYYSYEDGSVYSIEQNKKLYPETKEPSQTK